MPYRAFSIKAIVERTSSLKMSIFSYCLGWVTPAQSPSMTSMAGIAHTVDSLALCAILRYGKAGVI
jgi:hypothetical protein